MDTVTYRISGHSPSDASSYRDKSEIEAWREQDPLQSFGEELVSADVCSQQDLEEMQCQIDEVIERVGIICHGSHHQRCGGDERRIIQIDYLPLYGNTGCHINREQVVE